METQRPTPAPDGRTPPSLTAAWRAAVADILRFQDFAAALQLRNFLEYIVEETLAGRGDQLKERNIAVHALSRDSDFDSRLDCVVRVMACKLRRALERYYHGPGQHAAWRLEVPRGGYRPLFERADVRSDPACLISIPTRFAHGTPAEADQRQVLAVLPLWPLTSGAEELALAEAVACETCVKLRKFHWLEVLDYLVTRRWHQSHGGQPDQEQAQRCDYLIDGMCRRLGGQVRLTVQLTSVPDGHLHWAEQFDLACASSDFANEDAVVAGICRGIGSALHRGVPRSQQAGAAERPRRTRSQTWQPTPSPTVFPESDRQPVAAPKH